MNDESSLINPLWSHPSRVRGLKCYTPFVRVVYRQVAPFTGAWIEIGSSGGGSSTVDKVAPFTGAWIEITSCSFETASFVVAPFTGAWIEISPPLWPR